MTFSIAPLPGGGFDLCVDSKAVFRGTTFGEDHRETLEFVARAANNHQRLVDALRDCTEQLHDYLQYGGNADLAESAYQHGHAVLTAATT